METQSLKQVSFFQQIVELCKEHFKEKLLYDSIEENDLGMKNLLLQFNFFPKDESVFYPSLDGTVGVYESIPTVLHVYVNYENLADFYYVGSMNDQGAYEGPEQYGSKAEGEQEIKIFSIIVNQPEELIELVNYIKSFNENKKLTISPSYKFKKINTRNLIDGIYIYIPMLSDKMIEFEKIKKEFSILNFHNINFNQYPDVHRPDNMSQEEYMLNYNMELSKKQSEFEEISNLFLGYVKGAVNSPESGDIFMNPFIFNMNISGYYERLRIELNTALVELNKYKYFVGENNNKTRDPYIYIIFRLNSKTSYISFCDFLSSSLEGDNLRNELMQKNRIPNEIEYIENLASSIQYTIECRLYKNLLEKKMKSLIRNRENYELQSSLSKVRLNYLSDYYERDHKLIEIYRDPLPYIIESGFRKFIKSSENSEILKYGQQLLNTLLKCRLFIPLEEYIFDKNNALEIKTIFDKAYSEKPNTDGTLRDIYNEFCKIVWQTKYEFKCFNNLFLKLSNNEVSKSIGDLIHFRNRYHHAPYDDLSFIAMLKDQLPFLMPYFREAFSGVEFIIPAGFRMVNNKAILKAKRIMGFESQFDTIEKEIDVQDVIKYQSDILCAYNENNNAVVTFSYFLKFEYFETKFIEIGLFDRLVNGEPKFEF